MKIYYNFVITGNTYSYYKTSYRVEDSAQQTLKKIEHILSHFQEMTYTGHESRARLPVSLQSMADVIISQYREREAKIHWFVRLIFCFCIAIRSARIEQTYENIALNNVPEVLPEPPTPFSWAAEDPWTAPSVEKGIDEVVLTDDDEPSRIPTPVPTPVLALAPAPTSVPQIEPQQTQKRFSFPFARHQEVFVRITLTFFKLRELTCLKRSSRWLSRIADPVCDKIERPAVPDIIRNLKRLPGWMRGSALYDAAKKGDPRITFGCLLLGTDPNVYKDSLDDNVLHWAVFNGHLGIAAMLLKHKADPNAPGNKQETSYVQTYHQYQLNRQNASYLKILKLLLDKGTKPNSKFENGRTLLAQAVMDNEIDVIKLLVPAKADPNACMAAGKPLLHGAIAHRVVDTVRLLLDARANSNEPDGAQRRPPPLFTAYFNGGENRHALMELLLQTDADPNATNPENDLSLMAYTAYRAEIAVFNLLVEHKGDMRREVAGFTPFGWACGGNSLIATYGHSDVIIRRLIQAGVDSRTPMGLNRVLSVEIAERNTLPIVANLLWLSMPKLFHAIFNGDIDALRILLDEPVKVPRIDRPYGRDRTGETPLFYAHRVLKENGVARMGVMQLLLEKRAKPDLRDHNREALVDQMAWEGEADLLMMMIEHRANIHEVSGMGKTPLGWACARTEINTIETVRLLLENRANPFIAMKDGHLPITYPQSRKDSIMEDLLFHYMVSYHSENTP